MDSGLMRDMQGETAPAWVLPRGTARRLAAAPRRRWIAVLEGRVWLTPSAGDAGPSPDCWLEAGERAPIAPGVEVVLEGWPSARFELLEAAEPARPRLDARAALAWLSAVRVREQWTPLPVPCV